MPEQTTTTKGGTQITKRTPEVVPRVDEPCQAMITTQVIIAEPMSDGTWRLVTSFEDNYNIVLENREGDAARQEVVGRIQEIKRQWQDQKRIISLETLLTTGPPNSSKTPEKNSSSAPNVENI
jgi:hypothetical protein